jgi:uncharacterized protein YbaR (Trm112 family)
MPEEQKLSCPNCERKLEVSATIKFPALPEAVIFREGCPVCRKPFLVARMPKGLKAYKVTLASDLASSTTKRKAMA